MTKKWSANQEKFQKWLALPEELRDPPFQSQFAEKIGIHETTLPKWKKKPGFMRQVQEYAQTYLVDDVPAVLATLRARARRGDYQHLKLFLEMAGLHVDRVETDNEHRVIFEVIYGDDGNES